MRQLIIVLLLIPLLSVAGTHKKTDPEKPVYQLDWGIFPPGNCWLFGSWSERDHECECHEDWADRIKRENAQYAAKLGRNWLRFAAVLAFAGLVLVLCFHDISGLKHFGLGLLPSGAVAYGIGLWFMKTAEVWHWIGYAIALVVVIGLVALFWSKGLDVCYNKWKMKRKEGNSHG